MEVVNPSVRWLTVQWLSLTVAVQHATFAHPLGVLRCPHHCLPSLHHLLLVCLGRPNPINPNFPSQ